MKILRYFSRELLITTLVISAGWLILIVGNGFGVYLEDAERGDLSPDVLFILIAWRIPDYLSQILPIGFFLAILVTYGRLYTDSEMVVLSSCGFSKTRLLLYTMVPACIVSVVVLVLSVYLAPYGLKQEDRIKLQQSTRSELEVLTAARFQSLTDQGLTAYFQNFSNDRKKINDVFIAETSSEENSHEMTILTAKTGEEVVEPVTGRRFLLFTEGFQYTGVPGQGNYRATEFKTSARLIPRDKELADRFRIESVNFSELFAIDHAAAAAEIQWRLALPLLVFIVTMIAVPMSHTNPRQGRYFKLFPAFVLVVFYYGLLVTARGLIEEGKIPTRIGLWWVHGIYLLIATALLIWNNGQPLGRFFSTSNQTEIGARS
ncbi:LPS export ABC transporter permease LptF [Aurantivibrio infirmus]